MSPSRDDLRLVTASATAGCRHPEQENPPGEVVPLKLDAPGKIATASCPFPGCNSRRPSFLIFLETGHYSCVECGRHGSLGFLTIRWLDRALEARAWKPRRAG